MAERRFRTLNEYIYRMSEAGSPVTKTGLARDLGVWPSKLSALLRPDLYRVSVDDDLARRISQVLNQPSSYVRRLYPRKAA